MPNMQEPDSFYGRQHGRSHTPLEQGRKNRSRQWTAGPSRVQRTKERNNTWHDCMSIRTARSFPIGGGRLDDPGGEVRPAHARAKGTGVEKAGRPAFSM